MLAAKAAHSEHFSLVRRRLCGCTCTAASAAAQCLWLDRWASGISDVSCLFQTKRELIVSEYHSTEQQFVESMQMLVEVSSGRGDMLVEVKSGKLLNTPAVQKLFLCLIILTCYSLFVE